MKLPLFGLLLAPLFLGAQARPAALAFWTVDSQPALKIGQVDGPEFYSFNGIVSVGRTSGRQLAVLDGELNFLRVFDSTGKHLISFGKKGQGPGDFGPEDLNARIMGGDTIGVYESYRGRLQFFTAADGFVRQESALPAMVRTRVAADVKEIHPVLISGGSFLIFGGLTASGERLPAGTITRSPTHMYWASRDLRDVRDLGVYPGTEIFTTGTSSVAVPMFAEMAYGWDPGGRRICVGDTMIPRIQCHDRSTSAPVIVTWNHVPEAIPTDVIAAWKERRLAPDPRGRMTLTTEGRRAVGAAKFKEHKPAYSALLVDSELNVWVDMPSRRAPGQQGKTYAVFDPSGRFLGDVTLPKLDEVMEIHDDVVIGIVSDDVGLDYMFVHRLRKGR